MTKSVVQIWRRPKRRGQALRGVWQAELTLASSLDEAVIAEARRRRRPPPSPSITQLCWTKDDSKARPPPQCCVINPVCHIFVNRQGVLTNHCQPYTRRICMHAHHRNNQASRCSISLIIRT